MIEAKVLTAHLEIEANIIRAHNQYLVNNSLDHIMSLDEIVSPIDGSTMYTLAIFDYFNGDEFSVDLIGQFTDIETATKSFQNLRASYIAIEI